MDIYLDDHYPADAAHGCDYLTRNAQGDIQVETPDGIVLRREKVLITNREEDFEGRICIGERTVRHLAHQLGLVDEWRVDMVKADNEALRGRLVAMSAAAQAARDENTRLAQLEPPDADVVYVALDGTRHADERAALERSAQTLNLEPALLQDTVRTASPIPPVEVPV